MFRNYQRILTAVLIILISGLAIWQSFSQLHGATNQSSAPILWVTPLEIDLGPVGVGATSQMQAVTITNLGDATLSNFSGGGPSDTQFSAAQNCAGGVAPGNSCQYFFSFSPTATGSFTATSNSSTNGGPISIILKGTGVGPELTYSPLSLDFGSTATGATTAPQVVTIRNTGLSTLTDFSGGGVGAPFSAAQNCAGGVAPGDSCQYFFTFSPETAGTFTTTSNSSTNAGPISVDLQGRGRDTLFSSGQRVTPRAIDFGPVGVGTTSASIAITITNQSPFSTISNWAGGGVDAPFSAAQNCAGGVPAGGDCQFFYTFSPTESGVFTATSNVSNSYGNFSIVLHGTGEDASFTVSPLWLDFGPVPLNSTSPQQSVTIRNTGSIPLTNFAGGGVGTPFNASQNCAGGVAPGDSCQYFFTFSPTKEGQFTAYSSSNTNGGSFSIRLQGGELQKVFLPIILR